MVTGPIADLVAGVAEIQDAALAKLPTAPLDDRVAALRAARVDRARSGARARFAVLAAVAAVAGVFVFLASRPTPLRFEVGDNRESGVVGARIEPSHTGAVPLNFSDGTQMLLTEESRARVVSLSPDGALVVLERGAIQASVVHRPTSAWIVSVGPFDVYVKGTRFDASWDPKHDSFTLRMHEGLVIVKSDCLPAPRASVAGEVLELSCASTPPKADAVAPSPPSPSADSLITAPRTAVSSVVPVELPPSAPQREPPPKEAWRDLLARGDVDEALTAAESSGEFDDVCTSASASDLMLLGESARAAGRSGRAVQIYQAVRDRFPSSDFAANAAFHLGQVAFDQRASVNDARRWFSTYLGERPNGSLARQALGRLIEVEQRAGARSSARSLAERYLERFPDGPHAPLARTLVSP